MSSKFGAPSEKAPQIDTEQVLRAAQELYEKQKLNAQNNEDQESGNDDEEDSEEEMSFTSNEGADDEQGLLDLIEKLK
jgi:hypothetical protein